MSCSTEPGCAAVPIFQTSPLPWAESPAANIVKLAASNNFFNIFMSIL